MTSYFFPPEFVSDLRSRVNIVELVGDYVSLTRSGVNYKGLCPFHGEKTPSFMVHPDKGIFHCFGCGVGGDAIAFLKRIENLSYPETLERLGRRLGIDLSPYERRRGSEEARKRAASERERLTRVVAAAQDFFVRSLRENLGGAVGAYLEKRGITPAEAARFGLGLAPDAWSALKDELRRRRISEADAVAVGLLVRKEGSSHTYDRFRNRLMFPIHDINGVVVGFGGRILGDGEPKYLNSPESPIFNKRELLYDLHHARPAIGRTGRVFLVEGYMDALTLYRCGIDNVIATLGTALSVENVAAVKRQSRRVAVFFDNDAAGRNAAFRALPLFMAVGIMPDIVLLPDGVKDPDELAAGLDHEGLVQALERQRPLFDLFLQERGAGLENYNDRLTFLREVLEMIGRLPEESLRGLALRSTAATLHLAEEIILDEYRQLKRRRSRSQAAGAPLPNRPAAAAAGQTRESAAERPRPEEIILKTLLDYPELAADVQEKLGAMIGSSGCGRLFDVMTGLLEATPDSLAPEALAASLLDRIAGLAEEGEELGSLYARLIHLPVAVAEDLETARRIVADCLFSLERRRRNEQSHDLDRELAVCRDEAQMFEILQRKMELKKSLLA